MNDEVPRRIPGREYGRSIFGTLGGLSVSSNFSISKRVGWRIGPSFERGFTGAD